MGGGYCRLQMPLRLALGGSGTVAECIPGLPHRRPQVWDQIIHYSECTKAEMEDVVFILLQLLDGTSDVVEFTGMSLSLSSKVLGSPRVNGTRQRALSQDRYEVSEFNLHLMECRLAICRLLVVVLDLLAAEELDKVCPDPRWGGGRSRSLCMQPNQRLLKPRLSPGTPIFFVSRTAPKDHRPPTSDGQPLFNPVSVVLRLAHVLTMMQSVPVNVRSCWRYDFFSFFPSRTALLQANPCSSCG